MDAYLCFDTGRNSPECAATDEEGRLFHIGSYPTSAGIEGLLAYTKTYKKDITMQGVDLSGVTVSSYGAVNCDDGVIGESSAVPFVHDFSWKEGIQKELGLCYEIGNDTSCTTLSELFYNEAKNIQDMAPLVIGADVGGAIVRNRSIRHGAYRYGGESGMMLVKQPNSSAQNFSLCASTPGTVRRMEALTGEEWDDVRIFEETQQENELCNKVIRTFYEGLASGVLNIRHMLDPEMILFGSAISVRRDLTQRIMEAYKRLQRGVDFAALTPRLECCTYRQDADLLGALTHYRQRKGLVE